MTQELRAMVLAAGVGSRLQPLSDSIPKPLIKIGGATVMDHILLLLKKHGITNVISNTHYLASQIHDHFKDARTRLGIEIQFREEPKLSGVAGGIRTCKDFLKQSTACIIMGDALTDIDLGRLYQKHKQAVAKSNCLVTIAMMEVEDSSQFGVIVTESMLGQKNTDRVIKFQEKPSKIEALSKWANTGVYFFEPEVYDFIPDADIAPIYDVAKDLFPRLLKEGKYIQAIAVEKDAYWADLGTAKQYIQSVQDIQEGKVKLQKSLSIDSSAQISPNARLEGFNEIGVGAEIAENCSIKNCVIWDYAHISKDSELENCIVGPKAQLGPNSKYKQQILV